MRSTCRLRKANIESQSKKAKVYRWSFSYHTDDEALAGEVAATSIGHVVRLIEEKFDIEGSVLNDGHSLEIVRQDRK